MFLDGAEKFLRSGRSRVRRFVCSRAPLFAHLARRCCASGVVFVAGFAGGLSVSLDDDDMLVGGVVVRASLVYVVFFDVFE